MWWFPAGKACAARWRLRHNTGIIFVFIALFLSCLWLLLRLLGGMGLLICGGRALLHRGVVRLLALCQGRLVGFLTLLRAHDGRDVAVELAGGIEATVRHRSLVRVLGVLATLHGALDRMIVGLDLAQLVHVGLCQLNFQHLGLVLSAIGFGIGLAGLGFHFVGLGLLLAHLELDFLILERLLLLLGLLLLLLGLQLLRRWRFRRLA